MRPVIVIAGGSGFLGVSLAHHLHAQGFEVRILSRSAPKAPTTAPAIWSHTPWDARTLGPWTSVFANATGLVNLVGRTVDCIKTPNHQDEILRSRIEATAVLGAALRSIAVPPPVWVQMATAHIYGDPPSLTCDESSPFGIGLAPTVGRAWEAAFAAALPPSVRGVILRTSFVLGQRRGSGGGALATLAKLARLGLGGTVGSGTQGMSWIHELDMNRIFERSLTDPSMHGAYIASSPNPVSNQDFMRTLRRHAGGLGTVGIGLPAAEWMVRLGAPLMLRTDPELALYGRYVLPKRLQAEGFEFRFAELESALADLVGPKTVAASKVR